jgi:hypothetical protein
MKLKAQRSTWRLGAILILLVTTLLAGQRPALGDASPNAGKLLITEVSFDDTGYDWVELYVVDGSIDWSGYCFFEGGTSRINFDTAGASFETGDFVILHEEDGTDDSTKSQNNPGYWDFYNMTDLNATDGCLQIKESCSNGANRVDVVIYSNNDDTFSPSETEANGAVADGMWDAGANFFDGPGGDADAWTDTDDLAPNETLARYLDPSAAVFADSNSRTDWYHETNPTKGGINEKTLIELVSFTAIPHAGYVQIEWETASEIDNAGFNIWRGEAAGGPYTRLNATLIPAQGGPTWGARYAYADASVTPGVTYYYQLEDVDTHGHSTLHGPARALAGASHRLYLPLLHRSGQDD